MSNLIVVGDDELLTRQAMEIGESLFEQVQLWQPGESDLAREDPLASVAAFNKPDQALFVALDDAETRRRLIGLWRGRLTNLVHPTASVSTTAMLGVNILVGAQAVIGSLAKVGDGVVQNALSSIEHDNDIGAHSFLGTGAILCGRIVTGEAVFIGGGATVKPGTRIGARVTLGTGAVLIDTAEEDGVYVGNPARRIR